MSAQLTGKENIEPLLPHAGAMVLLESVQQWDETSIVCRTGTHRDSDNPLRHSGGLSTYAGLEYAAQAMALHGRLRAQHDKQENVRQGFIAVASKIVTQVASLHDIKDDVVVSVDLTDDAGDSSLYEFSLVADGQGLISGRLLVVLAQTP